MLLGASTAALDVVLALLLAVVAFAAVKLGWCKRRSRIDSDEHESDDDDDDDVVLSSAEALGIGDDSSGEKVALIAQERQRMQRAAHPSATAASPFASLRALVALPGAVVERKLLPPRCKLRVPKRFHKPHFHPLLDETAQWWDALQLQAAHPVSDAQTVEAVVEDEESQTPLHVHYAVDGDDSDTRHAPAPQLLVTVE